MDNKFQTDPDTEVSRTPIKRKCGRKSKPPRQSRRGASDVAPLEDVTFMHNKEEATTEIKTPRKRRRRAVYVEPLEVETVKRAKKEAATEIEKLHEKQSNGYNHSYTKTNTGFPEGVFNVLIGHPNKAHFSTEYVQLHRIGKGKFGVVYAGKRISDEFPVAIKYVLSSAARYIPLTLKGTQSWYPLEVILMLKAAGGPQSVGQSAAVSLLDWYKLPKGVVMVMERPVPSVTLIEHIQAKRIGPKKERKAKVIMKQLVEAAIDMHGHNIFHRDLKPGNILIESGPDGPRVRVLDFGCGCDLRNAFYTYPCGTLRYFPPEFFISGEYRAGPTTVWQLGAMLYQMMSGNMMFTTEGFLRKDFEILTEWSQDCQNLLKKCLAIDPCERATLQQIQQHPWLD